jgi:hypothetical protein
MILVVRLILVAVVKILLKKSSESKKSPETSGCSNAEPKVLMQISI